MACDVLRVENRMVRSLSAGRILSSLLILLVAAVLIAGQPDIDQKRAAGKAAFDEAIRLRQENTFRSYQLSLEQFRLSEKLYAEIGDKPNVGSALLGQGLILNLIDEKDAALRLYIRALAIFRNAGVSSLEARTLNNIGLLYDELGKKRRAIEYHTLALPLRKINQDRYGEANTLNSLGSAYTDIGEMAMALDHFRRALAIQVEIDDKRAQAITLSNLGRLYDQLGDKQKSVEYLERSLNLRRAIGDRAGEATTLNNLGMAVVDAGDTARAIGLYDSSLAILSELGFENRKASVLNNIAAAHIALGDNVKAAEFSRMALPLYRAASDSTGEATALNNIGLASSGSGDAQIAFEYLSDALISARSSMSRGLEAIILGNLMRTSVQLKRPAMAVVFGKQCIGTYQDLRARISELDSSTQRNYINSIEDNYRYLADLLIELGRFTEATAILDLLKEEEYSAFVRRDASAIKKAPESPTLTRSEQALMRNYARLAARVGGTGGKLRLINEKRRKLSTRDEKPTRAMERKYKILSSRLAAESSDLRSFLEKSLVNEIGTYNSSLVGRDLALQGKLHQWGNGTVAIYTVITENRYRVILTTPTSQIAAKTEISAAELNKKIFAFRRALQDTSSDPRPLSKELYDIIVKPIERGLTDAGARTLVWSLDGALRYIPLAALSPDGKTYLVERYSTAVLTPSGRGHLVETSRIQRALGFGVSREQTVVFPEAPDNATKIDALPGVLQELTSIIRDERSPTESGILFGRRYVDEEFTFGNLIASLAAKARGGRRFDLVHLASHFRLGNSWSSSFLILGNGDLLSLEKLSKTAAVDFTGVDLITLSACNTALGTSNGREVDSLVGAIERKSGRAVLATLWEVSDKSTADLMTDFYRSWKELEISKAAALQSAQQKLINSSSELSHPFFWSGFVLSGNWR